MIRSLQILLRLGCSCVGGDRPTANAIETRSGWRISIQTHGFIFYLWDDVCAVQVFSPPADNATAFGLKTVSLIEPRVKSSGSRPLRDRVSVDAKRNLNGQGQRKLLDSQWHGRVYIDLK